MTPTAEPVAWVLNLDAEDELALGRTHTPSAALLRRVEALLPVLTGPGGLVRPGDQLVFPKHGSVRVEPLETRPAQAVLDERGQSGMEGRAWSPTRWARTQLERSGVRVPRAPTDDVLRAVNHRAFCAALGGGLPGATYVTTLSELLAALAQTAALDATSTERSWLAKRPLSYAGKGRRKLRPGALSADDQRWLEASFREGGGLQLEPFVTREADFALHGWLHEGGAVTLGEPTRQVVDGAGQWVTSEPAEGALSDAERRALLSAGEATAEALFKAAYFGPFGLDAFRWVDARGDRHLLPRCELNARYSMGWAVGMRSFGAR